MTISKQEYANLSYLVYKTEDQINTMKDKDSKINVDGVKYKLLKFADNPKTNYQGAVFQRVDTGEIVVAHRGTQEGLDVVVDAVMVLDRTNFQKNDALALTQWAIKENNRLAQLDNISPPPVTVTGHSLGGSLAQLTAHHYNLKGETFNAYGMLGIEGIKENNYNQMINNVMISDPVSMASPHFGRVEYYTNAQEINAIKHSLAKSFQNQLPKNNLELHKLLSPSALAVSTVADYMKEKSKLSKSHGINNFASIDESGHKKQSVLTSLDSAQLISDNFDVINVHRNMVYRFSKGAHDKLRASGDTAKDIYGNVLEFSDLLNKEAKKLLQEYKEFLNDFTKSQSQSQNFKNNKNHSFYQDTALPQTSEYAINNPNYIKQNPHSLDINSSEKVLDALYYASLNKDHQSMSEILQAFNSSNSAKAIDNALAAYKEQTKEPTFDNQNTQIAQNQNPPTHAKSIRL